MEQAEMILQEGKLQFDFKDAVNGFKFDEVNRSETAFHGLSHCMKAVDFIVEMNDYYLFVEVKDFREAPDDYFESNYNILIKSLTLKFRDSFLYRWAEEKLDKPIIYICLLEFENPLISKIMKDLKRQLPKTGPAGRWQKQLVDDCFVVNAEGWNRNFPEWKVSHIQ